jgi:hypothetical protein
MAEGSEESTPSRVPALVQDLIGQLRGITERLEGLAEAGAHIPLSPSGLSLSSLRNLPLPGALSAAQLTSIASSVAAQRRSIQALQAQLTAFDEQLAVLERILGPLAEWSNTWAELEERLLALRPRPGADPRSAKPS